ncbi:MAG: hypothetical protein ACMUIG_07580 [Thermoplasmatota archaeon]
MRSSISIGVIILMITVIFAGIPYEVSGEDLLVHADSPGYEIIVGKDVTFKWHLEYENRIQTRFKLETGAGTIERDTSVQEYTWENYPEGSSWWSVTVWRDSLLDNTFYVGKTSEQNFYHLNTADGLPEYGSNEFAYRDGPRGGLFDTTSYYEVLSDYTVTLIDWFKDMDKTPDDQAVGKWTGSEVQHELMREHIRNLPDVEWDFITLKNGVLTIKEGYRWDGASTPFNWANLADNRESYIRCSCVHDSIYDLMRMGYLTPDKFGGDFGDEGFMNRLMADCMIYMINVEDGRDPSGAQNDFGLIRTGGAGKTHDPDLLLPWKYHASELKAYPGNGKVSLHWRPADTAGVDPREYGIIHGANGDTSRHHAYEIYRCNSTSTEWRMIDKYLFAPGRDYEYDRNDIFYVDENVTNGETYYYQIRSADPEPDRDWDEKAYDRSNVEAASPRSPDVPIWDTTVGRVGTGIFLLILLILAVILSRKKLTRYISSRSRG